jgi:hypothetical protein
MYTMELLVSDQLYSLFDSVAAFLFGGSMRLASPFTIAQGAASVAATKMELDNDETTLLQIKITTGFWIDNLKRAKLRHPTTVNASIDDRFWRTQYRTLITKK